MKPNERTAKVRFNEYNEDFIINELECTLALCYEM